jgi:tetratricopeptide (TPR) repeat protein
MNVDPRAFKGLSRFLAPSAGGPLADRALSEKRITLAQLQECVAVQDRTGRPFDEILVERGYLTAKEVTRLSNPALPPEVLKASEDPKNVLGHYVLVSRAGMGGMAEVWKAWDRSLGRWVAVKYLKEDVGQPTQRIEREGKMAAQLSHPGIITIFERGLHEGRPYLVMPLVNGASPKTPMPPKKAAQLAREVAQALGHAHQMGVIHRDVKPANLLVEAGGRVVLADFGLAISESAGASRWALSGTPEYASPEQIQGGVLDARTDIYSLGATLYHLLSGRPPFAGGDLKQTSDRVLNAPVPPLKKVPRALAKIVAKAMERDRSKRYASMAELEKDLRGFLDPIWGSLPSTPRALVAVLVAGALPWMVTGIIVWQRNRREARMEMMETVRQADQELARTEQLYADPELPLDNCKASAAETLGLYRRLQRDLDQEIPELQLGIGRCLELMNQEDQAEAAYRSAGRVAGAGLGLARISLRRHFAGRRDQDWRTAAKIHLEKFKASTSGDEATLLYDFASGRSAQVLAAAPRVLEQGGRHSDVLQLAVGVAATELGKWDEAALRFDQAVRLRRSEPTTLYWKGVALAGKGESQDAVVCLDQAIRSAPADWPLRAEAERRILEARR